MGILRVAIIGLGDIARKAYLPILTATAGVQLILSSRSADSVQELQSKYRVALGAATLPELIRMRPDAAFVLTPKETHARIVGQLLEADIDIFVEKPASMNADELERLADVADMHGRVLMVGFNRRFAPLHVKARELISDHHISIALIQKNRANAAAASLDEQYLEDTIHQIDLVRFYCGEGSAISTFQQIQDGRLVGAVSSVRVSNGGIAVIATSLKAGAWAETYALHGADQSLIVDAFDQLRLITPQGEQRLRESYAATGKPALEGRGFRGEVDHFLECVQMRSTPSTSARDSIKTLRLLQQMVSIAEPMG